MLLKMRTKNTMKQNYADLPADGKVLMQIPAELIPKCPDDGSDMTMNLRSDDSFVEDERWHRASAAYSASFCRDYQKIFHEPPSGSKRKGRNLQAAVNLNP